MVNERVGQDRRRSRVRIALMRWQLRLRPESWRYRIVLGLTMGLSVAGALLLVGARSPIPVLTGVVIAIFGPVIVEQQLRAVGPEAIAEQNRRIEARIRELEGASVGDDQSLLRARVRSPLKQAVVVAVLVIGAASFGLLRFGLIGGLAQILVVVLLVVLIFKTGARSPAPDELAPRAHHHTEESSVPPSNGSL